MDKITQAMMNLIGSEACGNELNPALYAALTEEERVGLYRVSKKHDLAHLVGNALINNGLVEEGKLKEAYRQEVYTAIYRYERILFETEELRRILNGERIPFVPLKGAVIRQFYPEPWMRTSCDIDILVHEEDLDRAVTALKEILGYNCNREEKGPHDIQLYSPSGVHLELHYKLVEENINLKAIIVLSDIWNYVEEEKTCIAEKIVTDDIFYFYFIAHTAKHFVNGGCGIKPFIDLWVYNHSKNIQINIDKRKELLSKGELLKFAENAEKLSEVWYGNIEHTDITRQMEKYLLKGGVYGTMQNRVAMQQAKSGGKLKYALSRIWLPYDTIKFHYPVLQKHKCLLPICEIRRWFKLLFKGGVKRSVGELSANSSITKEQKNEISSFLNELGLN